MFSTLVVGYLFLGGAGAGALVVICVLEAVNARRHFGRDARTRLGRTYVGRAMGPLRVESSGIPGTLRYYEGGYSASGAAFAAQSYSRRTLARVFSLPAEFFSRAWVICLAVLALGVLCLMADLGRPERIAELVVHPQLTAVTVGAYALVIALVVATAFAIGSNFDGISVGTWPVYVLSVLGVIAGFVTMAYTGVLLSSLASVLLWRTWLLPALFTLSSLSSGVALCFLAAAFVQTRQNLIRPMRGLANADGIVIMAEAVVLVAFVARGLAGEGASAAAQALVSGELSLMFWGGAVLLGMAVPFVMERLVRYGNYPSQLLFVAALVLAGGFLLRWCVVGAGSFDATQMPEMMYGLAQTASAASALT